jgi:hypothetical protein
MDMDVNAQPGPPAARSSSTTRKKLRIALCVGTVVLAVPALVLLIRSNGNMDLAADGLRHIAGCLISLGLLCLAFSAFLGPASPETPRWVIPTGVALAALTLALVLYGLTLYAFAFPSTVGLADALMLVASLGMVVDMALAALLYGGTAYRRVQTH